MRYYHHILIVLVMVLMATNIYAEPVTINTNPAANPTSTNTTNTTASTKDQNISTPPNKEERLPFMSQYEDERNAEQPSGIGLMARTVGALLLVIGLLVAAMWCLRRISNNRLGKVQQEAHLNVITTIPIGERRALTVVRFGGRLLLLGATAQTITLLASDDAQQPSVTAEEENLPVRSVAEVLKTGEVELFDHELAIAEEAQAINPQMFSR